MILIRNEVKCSLLFLSVIGFFGATSVAKADCSEAEPAKLSERVLGTWGLRFASGTKSCITFRFEKGGRVVQSSDDHCSNGGKAGSASKQWRIDESCNMVMTGVGESGSPRAIHFTDSDQEFTIDAANGPVTLFRK